MSQQGFNSESVKVLNDTLNNLVSMLGEASEKMIKGINDSNALEHYKEMQKSGLHEHLSDVRNEIRKHGNSESIKDLDIQLGKLEGLKSKLK